MKRNTQRAKNLLKKACELMGISENVNLRIKPLKTTIARTTFNSKKITITIDPIALNLDDEALLYIFVHELAHVKANTPYHSTFFWEEVYKVFPKEKAEFLENKILTLKANNSF